MARIVEEVIAIKVSQLVKDTPDAPHETSFDDKTVQMLEQVLAEIITGNKVVEIIREM